MWACFNDCKFVMSCHKRSAGKRHQIQIDNAKTFALHGEIMREAKANAKDFE